MNERHVDLIIGDDDQVVDVAPVEQDRKKQPPERKPGEEFRPDSNERAR